MAASIFNSAFGSGGGASRYGDFVVVRLQNGAFITTPMEFQHVSAWARGRVSNGNAQRDRSVFIERFETIIGRIGSAISTRGSRPVLARLLKSMTAAALSPGDWSLPHDINESVEIRKKDMPAPKPAA